MSTHTFPRWRSAGALAAFLLLAASGSAGAETRCDESDEATRQADRLHAEALAALEQPGQAARVASLMERAAGLREPCDVAAAEELRLAARAYHSLGRVEKARTTMLESADRAVWTGDVLGAAHAFLDAAALALEGGRSDAARQAVAKAETLSSSPLLTEGQRRSIRSRIGDEPVALNR